MAILSRQGFMLQTNPRSAIVRACPTHSIVIYLVGSAQCETGGMSKQEPDPIRKHLDNLLRMKGAHITFAEAVKDFPVAIRGAKPAGVPHSAWELLEHMRLAQEDILEFSRNPDYREKTFPDDYWPATEAPPDDQAWDNAVRQFERDLKEMQALVANTAGDLHLFEVSFKLPD